MKFTSKDLDHLTNLAKLELTEQEKNLYLKQLSEILNFVEKLNQLKIISATSKLTETRKQLRPDIAKSINNEDLELILGQFSSRRGDLLATQAIFDKK